MCGKKGIVIATMIEAAPFIKGLSLEQIMKKPFTIFSNDDYLLIISGIGKVYAALAAGFLIREYALVTLYNVGAAGGLREGISAGDIFHVSEVIDFDRPKLKNSEIRKMKPDINDGYRYASLVTLDRPVITVEDRNVMGRYADIVDMEGAGFLQGCRVFSAKGYIWKIVSDTVEDDKDTDIISNIKKLANSLFLFINEKVLTGII